MNWEQVWTIAGINIAMFGSLAGIIIWTVGKLDSDIKGLGARLDGHAQRIDQLYKMFVDLLKEKK
jgi:hypothetical protein